MRVPYHSEKENSIHRARVYGDLEEIVRKQRFSASLERKIEKLSCRSEKLGWNFTDFSAHVLEVLVILQHRKKVKRLTASKQRASRKNGV